MKFSVSRVLVRQLIGSKYAWSHEQGLRVSQSVLGCLAQGQRVDVDFSGISATTLQFLNSSIGTLIRELPWEDLTGSISVTNFPLRYCFLLEAVLIVWRGIDVKPHQVVKKTEVLLDIARLFIPFGERYDQVEPDAREENICYYR